MNNRRQGGLEHHLESGKVRWAGRLTARLGRVVRDMNPSEQFGMRALSRGSGESLSMTFATDHLPITDPSRPLTNGLAARFTLGIPEGIVRHRLVE